MAISKIDSDGITAGGITADSLNIGQIGGRRNLIINGAMVHDQRNGGSSVTPTAGGYNTVDRWRTVLSASSKYSIQQSTDAPSDFKNSLLVTSLAATSVGASDQYRIDYAIEGNDAAHLNLGTANAKTFTLSFWVKSSLTGSFGASAFNQSFDRCYPFSYSVNSANTWEYKTVVISGDTTGTWLTNNSVGLRITFGFGVGSTLSGTADAWTSSTHVSVSGAVNLVSTSGATWQITGVQLEVGSVATPFEHRSYGEELALCQRYYQNVSPNIALYMADYGGVARGYTVFPVKMRAAPTLTFIGQSFSYSSATDSAALYSASSPAFIPQIIMSAEL